MVLLLGGSFDPVHEGHLHLVRQLLQVNHPEKLFIIPARQNPLKTTVGTTPAQRMEMLALAFQEEKSPTLVIDDRELKREGPSYTIETVREIKKETGKEVTIVMGNEIYPDLPQWKEPVALLSEANLIVITREKSTFDPTLILAALGLFAVKHEKQRWFHSKGKWIELQEIDAVPISSTKLRETASHCHETGQFEPMPQGIQRTLWQYIKENRLYAVKR